MIGLCNQTVGSGVVWLASGTTRTSVPSPCLSGCQIYSTHCGPAISTWQESGHHQLHIHFSQLLQLRGKLLVFLVFVGKCWGGVWPSLGCVSSWWLMHIGYCDWQPSQVAQRVENLPEMPKTLVWEDPLEKGMAIHSSILAMTEEPGGLVLRVAKIRTQLSN